MEKAIRYSKKREAILNAMRHTDCHPTAEWVYQTLKPEYPDLSLGTVYRNLVFFQEQGVVKSVGVVTGQERFDATVAPPSHFVCTGCDAVMDLPEIRVPFHLGAPAEESTGCQIQGCQLTFTGRCSQCL